MASGIRNLLSLGLGLLAWILGSRGAIEGKFAYPSFASLSLTGISLTLQLYELRSRARMGDWAAIEDTVGAVAFAAVLLTAVTLTLNGIALLRQRKKEK